MKTLFISDLDGTLLNNNAEVSERSAHLLNSAIEKGAFFSAATARTAATVLQMLEKINVNTPIVLMNGVTVYDIHAKKYVKVHKFQDDTKKKFLTALDAHSSPGFIYCFENEKTTTYYENTSSPNAENFIKEREEKYGKKFTKLQSVKELEKTDVIYYSYSDLRENILPLYEIIREIKGLRCEFYADNYNPDFWYFEVCSCDASKENSVNFLRENYGFDKIIGYGDNFNDIPLFKACDECYATKNARDEVKTIATDVIGENDRDAVAEHILSQFD